MAKFEIRRSDVRSERELVVRFDEPIYFPTASSVSEFVIPLKDRPFGAGNDLEELTREVLLNAPYKMGPLLAPSPESSSAHVALLEERLARADEMIDRLLAFVLEPA